MSEYRMGIAIPQLCVPDVAASADFYHRVLGFDIRSSLGDPPVHAIVSCGNAELHLIQGRGGIPNANRHYSPGAYDVYIQVRGLQALAARLLTTGADIVDGPVTRSQGNRELVVRDLDGFTVTFAELPEVSDHE